MGWWGVVSTRAALERESERRTEAEVAKKSADENMALSLTALMNIFDAIAPDERLARFKDYAVELNSSSIG